MKMTGISLVPNDEYRAICFFIYLVIFYVFDYAVQTGNAYGIYY